MRLLARPVRSAQSTFPILVRWNGEAVSFCAEKPVRESPMRDRGSRISMRRATILGPPCMRLNRRASAIDARQRVAHREPTDETPTQTRLEPSHAEVTSLAFGGCETRRDFVPIDDVKERSNVVGPAVLIVQIVGVLPHVQAEDRRAGTIDNATTHQWVVLVGS